jgi:hypothetical protein
MPLTSREREFLDAYVYEVTHGPPFGGPATTDLRRKGVYYTDLSWLLTAYQRALSAEGVPADGIPNPDPPPSPWQSLEEVKRRDQALREELEGASGATTVGVSPAESAG